jgi:hypothetical protein
LYREKGEVTEQDIQKISLMLSESRTKYKMPAKANLKGRTSTISHALAISITPYITPNKLQIKNSYFSLKIRQYRQQISSIQRPKQRNQAQY